MDTYLYIYVYYIIYIGMCVCIYWGKYRVEMEWWGEVKWLFRLVLAVGKKVCVFVFGT